jgi:hypothetical protein
VYSVSSSEAGERMSAQSLNEQSFNYITSRVGGFWKLPMHIELIIIKVFKGWNASSFLVLGPYVHSNLGILKQSGEKERFQVPQDKLSGSYLICGYAQASFNPISFEETVFQSQANSAKSP